MNSIPQSFVGWNCKAFVSENVTVFCVCRTYKDVIDSLGLVLVFYDWIIEPADTVFQSNTCVEILGEARYAEDRRGGQNIEALPTPHSHPLTCTALRKCFPIVLGKHFVYIQFHPVIVLLVSPPFSPSTENLTTRMASLWTYKLVLRLNEVMSLRLYNIGWMKALKTYLQGWDDNSLAWRVCCTGLRTTELTRVLILKTQVKCQEDLKAQL